MKVEYVALRQASKEAVYFRHTLEELGLMDEKPIILYTNSQSAQEMAVFGHHARMKHIHYKYHFVREVVEQKSIVLEYLPTKEMIADRLTKSVLKNKRFFCFSQFGLII